jgi:hypothetical protein
MAYYLVPVAGEMIVEANCFADAKRKSEEHDYEEISFNITGNPIPEKILYSMDEYEYDEIITSSSKYNLND